MKYGMQPLVKGLVGGIAAHVVLGVGDSKLSLAGMVWSAPTVIGISVAGASIVSELSHDFVLMKIKGNNASLAELEQRTLAPLLTAAATIGAAYLTIGPVTEMRAALELAAIGAGAEIGGTYLDGMLMSLMRGNSPVHAI